MHHYRRNIGDYHKKAGRLNMLQHGAYTLLIDACYDRERFPTLAEAFDWAWANTEEEKEAVRLVLAKFFVLDGDVYVQSRIAEEIAKYKANAKTNQRIAVEREENRRSGARSVHASTTDRARSVHGSSTKRARFVHEPPPNHKPITNNQIPSVPDGTDAFASKEPVGNSIAGEDGLVHPPADQSLLLPPPDTLWPDPPPIAPEERGEPIDDCGLSDEQLSRLRSGAPPPMPDRLEQHQADERSRDFEPPGGPFKDQADEIWTVGKALLAHYPPPAGPRGGRRDPGSMIGKWLRDVRNPQILLDAIHDAIRAGTQEPVPYITQIVGEANAGRGRRQYPGELRNMNYGAPPVGFTGGSAFADLDREMDQEFGARQEGS